RAAGWGLAPGPPRRAWPGGAPAPRGPAGADKQRHDDLRETYRREGAFSALQKIVAQASPGFDDREPDVELPTAPDVMKDRLANAEFLFAHELDMYDHFQPDTGVLTAVANRVVIAGGRLGQELAGYRSAAGWARQLGTSIVEFPGGHAGYRTHPRAFVERLREVLSLAKSGEYPAKPGEGVVS